ncbi:MAG TPA: hypothetical protein PLF25_09530 [Accumulibacter sp.]|jgi:hypothetical protein|nr:hypothetical protein [Accumulibacter sp.]
MSEERTPEGAANGAALFPHNEERRSNIDRRRTPDRRKSRDQDKNLRSERNTSNKEIEALFAELEMRVTAAIRQNEWRSKNDGSGWDKLIVPLPKDFPPHNRRYVIREGDEGSGRFIRQMELEPL